MDDLKTIFDMKSIIERCLEECEQAKYIIREKVALSDGKQIEVVAIKDKSTVCDHIAKTLIGELLEFEVIRKLGPMFSQLRSIEANMHFIAERQAVESGYANLRIGQK